MVFQPGNKLGGRKKSQATITAQQMREKLVAFVGEEMSPLLEAKKDLALGHHVIIARKWESNKEWKGKKAKWVKRRTGQFYVVEKKSELRQLIAGDGTGDDYYKIVLQKPDNQAQNYLIDQAIGKAKDTVEVEGGPIVQIDKAVIVQIGKIYGAKQITGNGRAESNN